MPSPRSGSLLVGMFAAVAAGCAPGSSRAAPSDRPPVTAADIAAQPGKPIEQLLQEKASGVVVSRAPDGSIAIRIRGATSFNDTDAPLYLVDDMPVTPGRDGALSSVDPYSIESIRVLRGAEAGIYGIRGMNGVIVITTKRPGVGNR